MVPCYCWYLEPNRSQSASLDPTLDMGYLLTRKKTDENSNYSPEMIMTPYFYGETNQRTICWFCPEVSKTSKSGECFHHGGVCIVTQKRRKENSCFIQTTLVSRILGVAYSSIFLNCHLKCSMFSATICNLHVHMFTLHTASRKHTGGAPGLIIRPT